MNIVIRFVQNLRLKINHDITDVNQPICDFIQYMKSLHNRDYQFITNGECIKQDSQDAISSIFHDGQHLYLANKEIDDTISHNTNFVDIPFPYETSQLVSIGIPFEEAINILIATNGDIENAKSLLAGLRL